MKIVVYKIQFSIILPILLIVLPSLLSANTFIEFENIFNESCYKTEILEYKSSHADRTYFIADFQCKKYLDVCNGSQDEKCQKLLSLPYKEGNDETRLRSLLNDSENTKYKECMKEGKPEYKKKVNDAARGMARLVCKATLENCIDSPNSETCKESLGKYNISTNIPAISPLYVSAQRGDITEVKNLIKNGVNLNYQRDNRKGSIPGSIGWTSLMIASAEGHIEVVKYLLISGADVSLKSPNNESALSLANEYGYGDIVDILKLYGAK